MNIELTLYDVIQTKASLMSHNIKAIAPRLLVMCGKDRINVIGCALQDELDEIMEFIEEHHYFGRYSLEFRSP